MSEAHMPRKRSAAEWSYFIRRKHVLRAIRHPALTPAAKQVLVAFSIAADDCFILPERPPVKALARQLALAERTVRQAIAELVEQNCLTFRTSGECLPPGQGAPADPEARPDLAREWAFLSDARRPPSLAEYLDTLARLRDHAVAAKRIATAVSAERALGRALREAEQMRRPEGPDGDPPAAPAPAEEEAPLGAPSGAFELIGKVNADRSLSPAARHALIEVMLDRIDNPIREPDNDHHLCWSARLARRFGITPRGARKALAELEDLRLIAQAKGDVCVYPDRVEERLRRGAYVPPLLPPTKGLDTTEAHVHRLGRLRELAQAEGLTSTALAAHNAIGRALGLPGFTPAKKKKAVPKPAAPPAAPPKLTPADILPTLRGILASAPDAAEMVFEICAEIEAETAAPPVRPPADAAPAHAM